MCYFLLLASFYRIGLAIARRLAQDGAKIVISSRKQANVSQTVQQLTSEGLTAHGVVCHVSKSEDRKNLFNEAITKFGGVDILVSNAAANPTVGPVLEVNINRLCKIVSPLLTVSCKIGTIKMQLVNVE
jgi:dehydrogenase/reductase SDR family protein 4